ncbi:hypothetical protein [Rhizobium aouanii]|uniref:hypothetical protein n=1 Tax=Rhizobium aouanii TaxID=3118145 RepID=UPI0030042EDA
MSATADAGSTVSSDSGRTVLRFDEYLPANVAFAGGVLTMILRWEGIASIAGRFISAVRADVNA